MISGSSKYYGSSSYDSLEVHVTAPIGATYIDIKQVEWEDRIEYF